MGLVIAVLLLALLLGGIGLFVDALFWLVIISLALFIVGGVMGVGARRTRV